MRRLTRVVVFMVCALALVLPVYAYADEAVPGVKATASSSEQSDPKRPLENGVYVFKNVNSKKVLTVENGNVANKANIIQYKRDTSKAQTFELRYTKKKGYYTIRDTASGLVLEVASGSKKSGANVRLNKSNGATSQKWIITLNKDKSYTLRNVKSKLALSVNAGSKSNGANVRQYSGNKAPQHWTVAKVTNWLPNGVYNMVCANNTKMALGVKSNAMKAGANVESAKRADTTWAQNWVVVQDKDHPGYYTIRNMNSRMMLEVKGASAQSGANVQQAGSAARASQLWKPVLSYGGIIWCSMLDENLVLNMAGNGKKAGTNLNIATRSTSYAQKFRMKREPVKTLIRSSAFFVRNMDSGKVLDVKSSSKKNGAAIQLYTANKTDAQKFSFGVNGKGYSLVNINSYKAVDVNKKNKTKLTQQKATKAANQRFSVTFEYETGTFFLKSSYAGKRLDGTAGTLSLASAASTDAQRWILQPTTSDYFRVFLNSGHGWNSNGNGAFDTGAVGSGYREADFASDLCDRIIKYGREQYGLDIVDSRPYKLAYWKRLPKAKELGCSAIFSVHFDAGGGSGPMTMVGVSGRHPASMTFNNIMGKHLYKALPGLRHRGTSYRNDITCVNGSIPAVLVEVCFMDTPSDVSYYLARKDTVAKELAAGLYEASQQKSLRKKL